MQRDHSLQATSTLGNTRNLHIGFLHQSKPLYWFIRPGLQYWFPDRNSQLLHSTGNFTFVLLTGKATLLPTLFFALHKQDAASGSFKQQFALNLHFALIDANWRISSISRGIGLLGFCLPRLLDSCTSATSRTFWIYRTISTSFNLCWRSYCHVRLIAEDQVRLVHLFTIEQKLSRVAFFLS